MRKIFHVLCLLLILSSVTRASDSDSLKANESRSYCPAVLMSNELKTIPLNEFDTTPEDFASRLECLMNNGAH